LAFSVPKTRASTSAQSSAPKVGQQLTNDSIWIQMNASDHSSSFTNLLVLDPSLNKSDTTIRAVGDGSEPSRDFRVHRALLCCRSEFFRGLFESGMSESHSSVVNIESSPQAFAVILQFIYTDTALINGSTRTPIYDSIRKTYY